MPAGFLHNGVCLPTLAEATALHWAANPAFITPGSTSYLADVVFNGTVWQLKKYTLSSGGVLTLNSTTSLPALTFPTCDTMTLFNDGMTIGWGVAAAIIGAWVIKNLRRGM
jgi:hypothetical protein